MSDCGSELSVAFLCCVLINPWCCLWCWRGRLACDCAFSPPSSPAVSFIIFSTHYFVVAFILSSSSSQYIPFLLLTKLSKYFRMFVSKLGFGWISGSYFPINIASLCLFYAFTKNVSNHTHLKGLCRTSVMRGSWAPYFKLKLAIVAHFWEARRWGAQERSDSNILWTPSRVLHKEIQSPAAFKIWFRIRQIRNQIGNQCWYRLVSL